VVRIRVERLDRLPLRPQTARLVLKTIPEPGDAPDDEAPFPSIPTSRGVPGGTGRHRPETELDPGWVLNREVAAEADDPLSAVAGLSWWQAPASGAAVDAMQKLWRHSAAVASAARRLAAEAGDPAPEQVAAAGLLHHLALWAVTAVDPEWLVRWLSEPDRAGRLRRERDDLGEELTDLGRRIARRWGCPALIVDAAWLHSPRDAALGRAARDPARMALIQEAVRWAETTPWALAAAHDGPRDFEWDHPTADPRVRILVAEIQSRCGNPFIAPDATPHEERMARQNARLRLQLAEALEYRESSQRFLTAFAESDPADRPEVWARAAGLTWCAEPSVTAARVVWTDPDTSTALPDEGRSEPDPTAPPLPSPPSLVVPLGDGRRRLAEIQLWCERSPEATPRSGVSPPIVAAWTAWAARVADRSSLDRQFRQVLQAHREAAVDEEARLRRLKLDALAEFAAGAGHEINNPLAVIVGRSQLLLARADDPEQGRSLRIIMAQAQRAHRILRDLMFFARPPAPRPRPCRPAELLRACVADFTDESTARGVVVRGEIDDPAAEIHADADALRHLAEVLIRNAIQATPAGGTVHVKADAGPDEVRWSVTDSGPGVTAAEGVHLFDPFFCGRQAGRGLGLGLPRASRIVDLAGGRIQWSADPRRGTTFRVHLPRTPVPRPAAAVADLPIPSS
jgi:signal transduction histidine kinase